MWTHTDSILAIIMLFSPFFVIIGCETIEWLNEYNERKEDDNA